MVIDTSTREIEGRMNFDFIKLISPTSELARIGLLARGICFDRLVKDFIRRYPGGIIVNIGCGLDTTYDRVNNGLIMWYDLDLPYEIELRKPFIKETRNRKFIACSFLDNSWHQIFENPEHILIIAAGVFCYHDEIIVRTFFLRLSEVFPSCELLFDVITEKGVRVANGVLRKIKLNEEHSLKWGLKNTDTILSWCPRLRLLGKYYIFKQKSLTMSLKNRLLGWIFDSLNIQYIVHFKIRLDYKHIK